MIAVLRLPGESEQAHLTRALAIALYANGRVPSVRRSRMIARWVLDELGVRAPILELFRRADAIEREIGARFVPGGAA